MKFPPEYAGGRIILEEAIKNIYGGTMLQYLPTLQLNENDVVTFLNGQWDQHFASRRIHKNAWYLYNTKKRHFDPVAAFYIHF